MAEIKGNIKWYDAKKGYGFITGEDGVDYFVHFSGVKKARHYTGFDANDEVTFEITEGKKGPQASGVELVTKPKEKKEKKENPDTNN